MKTFFIFSTDHNDEKIVAIINFFGCVDCEFTTHEIRGLNVVVRLRKSYPVMWPRLQFTAEKCSWILQNIDAIRDEEFYGNAVKLGKEKWETSFETNNFSTTFFFEKKSPEKLNQDSDSDEDLVDNITPMQAQFDLEDDDYSYDEQLETASF